MVACARRAFDTDGTSNRSPCSPAPEPLGKVFVTAQLSQFARSLSVETAFTVLAVAKSLKTAGKDVVELEIGDSPFDSTASAKTAGVQAIEQNQSHYCPSPGIPEFREAAARFVKREFNIPAEAKNIIAGPGQDLRAVFLRGVLGSGRRRA